MPFTPFMRLRELIAGRSTESDYARAIDDNIAKLDEHDHSGGRGKPIPFTALTPDGNLFMDDRSITNARSFNMIETNDNLVGAGALFMDGGNLFFKDALGQVIGITSGGQLASIGVRGRTDAYVGISISGRTITMTRIDGVDETAELPPAQGITMGVIEIDLNFGNRTIGWKSVDRSSGANVETAHGPFNLPYLPGTVTDVQPDSATAATQLTFVKHRVSDETVVIKDFQVGSVINVEEIATGSGRSRMVTGIRFTYKKDGPLGKDPIEISFPTVNLPTDYFSGASFNSRNNMVTLTRKSGRNAVALDLTPLRTTATSAVNVGNNAFSNVNTSGLTATGGRIVFTRPSGQNPVTVTLPDFGTVFNRLTAYTTVPDVNAIPALRTFRNRIVRGNPILDHFYENDPTQRTIANRFVPGTELVFELIKANDDGSYSGARGRQLFVAGGTEKQSIMEIKYHKSYEFSSGVNIPHWIQIRTAQDISTRQRGGGFSMVTGQVSNDGNSLIETRTQTVVEGEPTDDTLNPVLRITSSDIFSSENIAEARRLRNFLNVKFADGTTTPVYFRPRIDPKTRAARLKVISGDAGNSIQLIAADDKNTVLSTQTLPATPGSGSTTEAFEWIKGNYDDSNQTAEIFYRNKTTTDPGIYTFWTDRDASETAQVNCRSIRLFGTSVANNRDVLIQVSPNTTGSHTYTLPEGPPATGRQFMKMDNNGNITVGSIGPSDLPELTPTTIDRTVTRVVSSTESPFEGYKERVIKIPSNGTTRNFQFVSDSYSSGSGSGFRLIGANTFNTITSFSLNTDGDYKKYPIYIDSNFNFSMGHGNSIFNPSRVTFVIRREIQIGEQRQRFYTDNIVEFRSFEAVSNVISNVQVSYVDKLFSEVSPIKRVFSKSRIIRLEYTLAISSGSWNRSLAGGWWFYFYPLGITNFVTNSVARNRIPVTGGLTQGAFKSASNTLLKVSYKG